MATVTVNNAVSTSEWVVVAFDPVTTFTLEVGVSDSARVTEASAVRASGTGWSLSNNFEGGSAGAPISTANTGGPSGNAFDVVTVGTGVGLTFDTNGQAHGAGLAAKIVQASTVAVTWLGWTTSLGTLAVNQTIGGRLYLTLGSSPPASTLKLFEVLNGTTVLGGVGINANALLTPLLSGGSNGTAGGTALAANTLYRIEWQLTGLGTGSGAYTIQAFLGDSTTPFGAAVAGSAVSFGLLAPDGVRIGNNTTGGTPSGSYWLDSINVNDSGMPGPDVTNPPVTVNASETVGVTSTATARATRLQPLALDRVGLVLGPSLILGPATLLGAGAARRLGSPSAIPSGTRQLVARESVTVQATPALNPNLIRIQVSESVALTDTPGAGCALGISLAQPFAVSAPAFVSIKASESVAVTDNVNAGCFVGISLAQPFAVSPALQQTIPAAAETVALDDGAQVNVPATVNATESVAVTGTISAFSIAGRTTQGSDSVAVTDTPAVGLNPLPLVAAESATVRDSPFSTPNPLRASASEQAFVTTGASLGGVRRLGAITVTVSTVLRPDGLLHDRVQGSPKADRHQAAPVALAHARAQGDPVLSGRALPAGLTRARQLGAISVNELALGPIGLNRSTVLTA